MASGAGWSEIRCVSTLLMRLPAFPSLRTYRVRKINKWSRGFRVLQLQPRVFLLYAISFRIGQQAVTTCAIY
jgi:hypothetical protein